MQRCIRWYTHCRGQSIIEYTLIIALVVVVLIVTLLLFGPQLSSIFRNIENNI